MGSATSVRSGPSRWGTVAHRLDPTSLALVAGETGVATFGVVVVLAVLLLARAEVWRRQPPCSLPEDAGKKSVRAGLESMSLNHT